MAGLIDSSTGLDFGTGLQWQTPIGGAGLDIVTETVAQELLWGAGNFLEWGALLLVWGNEP